MTIGLGIFVFIVSVIMIWFQLKKVSKTVKIILTIVSAVICTVLIILNKSIFTIIILGILYISSFGDDIKGSDFD